MSLDKKIDLDKQEKAVQEDKLDEAVGSGKKTTVMYLAIGVFVLILAGVGTGYALSRSKTKGVSVSNTGAKTIQTEKVVGSLDEAFSDEAEGELMPGGIDGEGTHHIDQDGNPARYVYITSSVIALDDYTGKKVRVWGETFASQKAGWLMDVGKLEVLE